MNSTKKSLLTLTCLAALVTSCYKPPYNDFRKDHRTVRNTATGAVAGTAVGLISGYVIPGLAIGAAAGGAIGAYKNTKHRLIIELQRHDIEYVEYGNLRTLIIPVDQYFEFNSARLNELCYAGLAAMLKLLAYNPDSPIYVAAFSDNVGSDRHKEKMTQAQAEAMLTFLWANGFRAAQLKAEGYGDYYSVSDNNTVHGSAQNRRIEVQWSTCKSLIQAPPMLAYEK